MPAFPPPPVIPQLCFPTLELQRGSSELDQRHCCHLVTLAINLLLPDFCGKVSSPVRFSFLFRNWQIEKHAGSGTCPWGGCVPSLDCGSEVASKISAHNRGDKLFLLRVCLHWEVYHYNYTLCYTSISTPYECSYFEISVSKQSYTGVFSSIIMLANSKCRPDFRRQCHVTG